jgi:hypothetical protein
MNSRRRVNSAVSLAVRKSVAMTFITSWQWWLTMVSLGVIGYVQDVRSQFEKASGVRRVSNMELYHFLFRGLPWIIIRSGGFVRIAILLLIFLWWGWRAAVISILSIFIVSFALRLITIRHAQTMLAQCAADDFGGSHRLCASCNRVWPLSYFALDSKGVNDHVNKCVGCSSPAARDLINGLRGIPS